MTNRTTFRPAGAAVAALALALLLAACSGSGGATPAPATTATAAPANRPRSTATLTILAPRNGQTVKGSGQEIRLSLKGATITSKTTTRIRPDQGHVHLIVDGKLVAMNYGLTERLPPLSPGVHVVQVEFVAADHLPFEPRVLVRAAFQVAG